MRKQLLTRSSDDGAIAIIVALLVVVLAGLSAFAVDFGNAYATNRTLSTAADGAALAAAQRLAEDGLICGPAAPGAAAARKLADHYSSDLNAPGSALQAGAAGFELSTDLADGNCLVTVRNIKAVPFAFGGVLGLGTVSPRGVATAKYGQARTVTGLRPFGLCATSPDVLLLLADGAVGATPQTRRISVDNLFPAVGPCGEAPGDWGTLNLLGGDARPSDKIPNLRKWITSGFPGTLDLVNNTLTGDPGTSAGDLTAATSSIVGQTITLPVYDVVTMQGANATFHIVSYVSATLVDYNFSNPNDYLDLRFKSSFTVGEYADCRSGCAPSSGVLSLALVDTP